MNRKQKVSTLLPGELIVEYSDVGVEKLIEESKQFIPALDILSTHLPYVKTLVAAVKFPRTLSDFLLGRKVYTFLYSSKLDKAMIEKLDQKFSKVKQERLWERVVFSINSHDDSVKSEIIGKLFTALVDEFIEESEFFAMVHATNSLNTYTLDGLKELYSLTYNFTLSGSQYYSFVTLGLIDIDNSNIGTVGGGGPTYPLNQIGWKYIGIAFDFPPSSIEGIKIGKGPLVAELDDKGQMTNYAYPLSYIQTVGSRHREVNLFDVNEEGQILCDVSSGLPFIVATELVLAGIVPLTVANKIASDYSEKPLGIAIRNMEDTKVQMWSYIVKGGQEYEGVTYKSSGQIKEMLANEPIKTDETRYFVDVVDQIVRHTDGDLKHVWEVSSTYVQGE